MRKQRIVVLQDAPYGVFLVLVEVVPAQHRAVHAGEGQMRSVVSAQAQIVERVVVIAGESLSPIFVLPYPFTESVLQLLLRLAGRKRLLLVDDAGVLGRLVVNRGRASVERV